MEEWGGWENLIWLPTTTKYSLQSADGGILVLWCWGREQNETALRCNREPHFPSPLLFG